MKELYTVGFYKVLDETVGNDLEHHFNSFEFKGVKVNGEKMDVYFCKNEKGIFVVAGKFGYVGSCWARRKPVYHIYFRKNFKTKEEGNAFYKRVKATMSI